MIDRCPLLLVEYEWPPDDPDADRRVAQAARPCDADLHLVWYFDIPLNSENVEPIPAADAQGWANTDGWEVVCENGHKLALSSGEENAEPYEHAITFPPARSVSLPEPPKGHNE